MSKCFELHFDNELQQYIITANKGFHRCPVATSVRDPDMYSRGLQAKFVNLVDMREVFDSLRILLESLKSIGSLNEKKFLEVTDLYFPFIEKRVEFETLTSLLNKE